MSEPTKNYILKICCCGDGSVGKTSMVLQFCERKFQENYIMTIGSNFAVKEMDLPEINTFVKLQIWDLAGQQHFSFVRPPFYRGASGTVMVFDITRRESFQHILDWKQEVDQVIPDKPFIIVGNKIDLADERVVSKHEGEELAKSLGVLYYETSAKTGENLNVAFRKLVDEILSKTNT
ncbi:MAG: GTP-binding protein [Candidatus Lokiarchaeota archaeon]|nr:GTP-binding protein [Candidatus Lokiarchaeota archaeon]